MILIKERTRPVRLAARPVQPSREPARLHGAALALILTAAFMVVLDSKR